LGGCLAAWLPPLIGGGSRLMTAVYVFVRGYVN